MVTDDQSGGGAVFLAHGAPSLALEDTAASRFLKSFAAGRPRPESILILSPHWETEGLKLSAPGPLRTYHDFRGFPAPLYEISYPAVAGEAEVGAVAHLLEAGGHDFQMDSRWGLDHGAWVPLSLAFPDADIPVTALSLPHDSTPATLFALGRILAPLKEKGVLIVGSGSTTHNLGEIRPQGSAVPDWTTGFDRWLDKGLQSGSIDWFGELGSAPDFRRNHPTEDHLLPLFFAFGAGGPETTAQLLHRSYEYGTLSMSYYDFAPRS
ncbi:class III extradiol ring-cleavage dioxygenase [Labrenzia sp. 011]|uniref:DODA-type extradiol aromatic ring-opening family dioxygenase n=1 Tax=Labrenzia sp. 011 TaxID=2171494 RepID=UPI000D524C9C|nr:class III extradiol ring-cleavage dioxygenase [Labrenzia sp. 011]PVB60062.1 dioxygenase [Labrenzia sp. 011]